RCRSTGRSSARWMTPASRRRWNCLRATRATASRSWRTTCACTTPWKNSSTNISAPGPPTEFQMPKRTDIKTVLIIGAGPIVIGQAGEFDYSGAQACKALREEGYRVVLVNSNPATTMTDPEMADAVYIEPITWHMVEKIIAKEKPDALLPTMGGQTALNCALELADQ